MYENNISKAFRRHYKTAAVIFIAALSAGCSSGMERFSDSFYSSAVPTDSDANNNAGIYQPNQNTNGAVVSNQLPPPPAQPNYAQSTYPQSTYAQGQANAVQTASAGQTMGTPPQNLGTLPASTTYPTTPVPAQTRYTVQAGDTIYNISRRSGVGVDAITKANNIQNGIIHLGQTLIIPGASSVAANSTLQTAKPAATPPRQQVKPPVIASNDKAQQLSKVETPAVTTNQSPATANQAAPTQNTQVAAIAPQATGIAKLRWPVQGRIISSFGQNQGGSVNDGIDIMVPEGASVRAAENGVVIDAVEGLKKYGNTVLIRHENNIVTVYGHNSKIFVQRGQSVRRGDEIAKSGMSGDASTPRVHFEVRKNAAPVNPIDYLEN